MTTQTWWVDGRILGSAPAGLERTHNQLHPPVSYAWFCPHCGEIWARRIISPSRRWFAWTGCCVKCEAVNNNSLRMPGSIWLPSDPEYLANLPHFMYRYEAETALKFWHR